MNEENGEAKGKGKGASKGRPPPPVGKGECGLRTPYRVSTTSAKLIRAKVRDSIHSALSSSGQPMRVRKRRGMVDPVTRKAVLDDDGQQIMDFYWIEETPSGELIREVPPEELAAEKEAAGMGESAMTSNVTHKPFEVFDNSAGSWCGLGGVRQVDASPASLHGLKILTYNTWFGPTNKDEAEARFHEAEETQPGVVIPSEKIDGVWESRENRKARHESLFKVLEQENADIVCLQEVRPLLLEMLQASEFVRQNYALSSVMRGGFEYGLAILIRRTFKDAITLVPARKPGEMMIGSSVHDFSGFTLHTRIAMLVELNGVGKLDSDHRLFVVTAHLDSEAQAQNRMRQLQYIIQLLDAVDTKSPFTTIVAGDMNFDDSATEQHWFEGAHAENWGDAWRYVYPDTYDKTDGKTVLQDDFSAAPRPQERIDRIFFHRASSLAPCEIALVGREGILSGGTDVAVRPSDHLGLVVTLRPR